MALTPIEITGVEPTLARRLLAVARSIAPCLDSLEGEAKQDAIVILRGVAAEVPAAGQRHLKSLSRNGTSMAFADVSSAFSDDDRAGLRALCSQSAPVGVPLGSFPQPADIITNIWPETYT